MEIGDKSREAKWVKYPGKNGDSYLVQFTTDDKVRLEIIRDQKAVKEDNYDERGPNGWYTRIVCMAVLDWKGITMDGKPYPCTDENKRDFFSKFSGSRGNFILKTTKDEKSFLGESLEEDTKN